MCCKCLGKLKSSYDFILQIHDVNKKYLELLDNCNDPLQEGLFNEVEVDNITDCLAESTIDLPLNQYIPEIKIEVDFPDPYNIVLDNNLCSGNGEAKLENEGTYNTKVNMIKKIIAIIHFLRCTGS